MAKIGGLGDRLLVGGFDISGDIQALDKIGGGPSTLLDVTDITQSAHERRGGLRDGTIGAAAFFDAANAHPVLSALPVADTIAAYLRGTALAGPVACINAKQVGYDPNRDQAGNLILKTEFQANGFGLEWGEQLTAGVKTDATGSNGTAVDYGAPSTLGAQAYLQLTALTGTTATIQIQQSTDNSTWVALASFSAVTAAGKAQRLAIAGNIDRYIRVVSTGTFSSVSYAVAFMRNPVAVSF